MTDDFERDPLARELRASLSRHAAEAPRGDALADHILRTVEQQPADVQERRTRSWRTWALPLAAVGAVAAVVGTVIGIQSYRPTASAPAGSRPPSLLRTSAPSPSPLSSSATTVGPSPAIAIGAPNLFGVKILDLSFANGKGWALASANCSNGSGGKCTALLHTTDGTTWVTKSTTPFRVPGVKGGCTDRCVDQIRFATESTGYVYGPNAFLMTTDGGDHWKPQRGGAIALETLDNNVIRVTSRHPGCPSWCDVQVETSGIGSTSWKSSSLGTAPVNAAEGVQLTRSGKNAYLLLPAHVTGGAEAVNSAFYRSADDGGNWTASSDPCQPASQSVAAIATTAGGDGGVSALCAVRTGPTAKFSARFLAVSADAGAHFTARPDLPQTADLLTGDPATGLIAAGIDGLQRSSDGGRTWHTVADVTGQVTWVGFETTTEARAVTNNQTIWTTEDGGKTWSPVVFQ